ncbi:hypothetical protein [Thermocrinis sp.]|jgi:hypothetical protein|uniref:hypothetical protein n=1 Tax=Thermocrinis sp. TaxID=2024383 RepID=UPI00260F8934|nr:hypothetical protein [Thermocrinis sp.]
MFVSLQLKLELKKEDKEKPIKLVRCLASSEGSPSFPYPWTNSTKGFSPLKSVLVEGVWDRMRSRLVPLSAGRTIPIRDL